MQAGQFNPIRFFANKLARQWEKTPIDTDSVEFHMVFHNTGVIPAFCLLIPSDPQDASPTFTCGLYTTSDELVYSIEDYSTSGFETYQQINYLGTELDDQEDGYYYLKATINGVDLFSDVFAWTSDTSELMQVTVATTDVRVGDMILSTMNASEQSFYINARQIGIKPKIDQDGDDQNAITRVIWGSRAIQREWEIDASESIYIYLSALAMLKSNGTISLSYGYETFTVSEISVEESTNHNNGLYQLKMTVADELETVSVKND